MTKFVSLKLLLRIEQNCEAVFSQEIVERSGLDWVPKFDWTMTANQCMNDDDNQFIYSTDHHDLIDRKTYWSNLFRPGYGLAPVVFHRGRMMVTDPFAQFVEEMTILYGSEIQKLFKVSPSDSSFDKPLELWEPWMVMKRFWSRLLVIQKSCIKDDRSIHRDFKDFAMFQDGVSLEDCLERFSQPILRHPSALVKINAKGKKFYFLRHWFEWMNQGWSFGFKECRAAHKDMQGILPPELLTESIAKVMPTAYKPMSYIPSWVDVSKSSEELFETQEELSF
jgi:hypothetical protein